MYGRRSDDSYGCGRVFYHYYLLQAELGGWAYKLELQIKLQLGTYKLEL